MNRALKTISVFFLLTNFYFAHAQKNLSDTLNVVKQFNVTLADAYKINENPVIIDSTKKNPALPYSISSKKIIASFNVEPIRPAKIDKEPLNKLYNTLIKAGFGNYATPYGEIFYSSLRSKEWQYGAHAKHISSLYRIKNSGYTGYSDNELNVFGKKYLRSHTLGGDVNYNHNLVHYYGYDAAVNSIEDDVTRQWFSNISAHSQLQSHYTDSAKINHIINLNYYNLTDRFKSVENMISTNALLSRYYDKQLVAAKATVDYFNNKIPVNDFGTNTKLDTTNQAIINFEPAFGYKSNKWEASLGFNMAIESGVKTNFFFYPKINFNFNVIDNILIPYAGVTGGLKKNSYKSLTDENPFIMPNVEKKNADKKVAYAGLRGSITNEITYNVHGSYSKINNMHFFVNDFIEPLQNRFGVVYDTTKLVNIHGEIQYQQNQKLILLLKGDWFKYVLNNLKLPYHKPELEITFSGSYNLKDKIRLKSEVFYIGKQYAWGPTILLKPLIDINFGIEYHYTKRLGAFLNLNNVAGFKYERWHKYPTHKFFALGGISYSF